MLFGCCDGYVYCLRAADGALAWRFQAAPENRRMVAYEQVESVWPVPGSVLVQDGVVYCVAGRSMFLDGGLRLLRLDANTGRKLSETVLDDRDPETGKNLQSKAKGMNMPVALPDILSCDGRYVYMRSLPFNLKGERQVRGVRAREGAERATTSTCSARPASSTTRCGTAPTGCMAGLGPRAPAATSRPADWCPPAGSWSSTTRRFTATAAAGSTSAGARPT